MRLRGQNYIDNLRRFPRDFWVLMGATFIDQLGGALLFPFFALYITAHFNVGLTEVGIVFTAYAGASFFGNLISGVLTDRLGRRWMLLFGLIVSGLTSLLLGLVDSLALFYVLAAFIGLLANSGGPAQKAMVADLLPPEQHAEGYGLSRVVGNLAFAIGPAIGGLLAAQSFMLLFVFDAVSSLITAVIVFTVLPETRPTTAADEDEETFWQTLRGYRQVLADRFFVAFLLLSTLTGIVYFQLNSTLSVFLRDEHGMAPSQFGLLLSLNAALVVLFQIEVTRRLSGRSPLLVLAAGVAFYGLGFTLFGFVATISWFALAIVIVTIGEMIVTPIAQALVARLAPAHMRGRYMATFGLAFLTAAGAGPLAAGIVVDNFGANWVWYLCGVVCALIVVGYLVLARGQERGEQ